MKASYPKLLNRIFSCVSFLVIFVLYSSAFGQTAQNVPKPDDSKPFSLDSTPKILIYIALPIFFALLYLWLRRRSSKRKE